MKKGDSWKWIYEKNNDKNYCLRQLLAKLIEECLEKEGSPRTKIPWNKWETITREKPFDNCFRKKNVMNKTFTSGILGNFLFLCVKKDEENEEDNCGALKKAVKILKKDYDMSEEDINWEKFHSCSCSCDIRNEDESSLMNKEFLSKCGGCPDCPVVWLYEKLQYIQENYDTIMFEQREIGKKRNELEEIDKDFVILKNQPDILIDYYKFCEDIPSMSDENLAYIEWYIAHLARWPYLPNEIAQLQDESKVYNMLSSASLILKGCNSNDEELLTRVETERIVSYMSLIEKMSCTEMKKEMSELLEKSKKMEEDCKEVLAKVKEPQNYLRIYLELWNLNMYIRKMLKGGYEEKIKEYKEKIDEKIKELVKDNDEVKLLNAKFKVYLYYYYHNEDFRKEARETLHKTAQDFLKRKQESYNDTMDIIENLYIYEYQREQRFSRMTNSQARIFANSFDNAREKWYIEGNDNGKDRSCENGKHLSPSFYERIFLENPKIADFDGFLSRR